MAEQKRKKKWENSIGDKIAIIKFSFKLTITKTLEKYVLQIL